MQQEDVCCEEALDLLVREGGAKVKDGQTWIALDNLGLTALRYCPFCGEDALSIARSLTAVPSLGHDHANN